MKWNHCDAGIVQSATQRFLTALGDDADSVLNKMLIDRSFAFRIAEFAIGGGHSLTSSQKGARTIMGANFFGIEEAMRHFGATPSQEQRAQLSEIPFSSKLLHQCRHSHILVAVLPLSLRILKKAVKRHSHLINERMWPKDEKFCKKKGKPCWELISMRGQTPSCTWDEQVALLANEEKVPEARVMAYMILGHFLSTGTMPYSQEYVRCADVPGPEEHVQVGWFDTGGLCIGKAKDNANQQFLSIATAKKHQP